jgi:addiction module RelB/DinJ family antitoxin
MQVAHVDIVAILTAMTRSAIIQARVRPEIKFAGEQVLRSIGLTMTEAMELFLRRLVVDQRLPFEVVALDEPAAATIMLAWQKHEALLKTVDELGGLKRSQPRKTQKRE